MYFEYGNEETNYLKKKDKKLGEAIDKIGHIYREVDDDMFSSVIHSIISQQISKEAELTVWSRLRKLMEGEVTPKSIAAASVEEMQKCGMTFRKAEYIKDFGEKVYNGEFDLDTLESMSDEEVIASLSSLKGIGIWTAEMLLTFAMQRPDVISYGDLAILRGMRMLYRHREITKELFNKYKKRYSPYATVASLYFWAIAAGAIPELTDPAPKKKKEKKK